MDSSYLLFLALQAMKPITSIQLEEEEKVEEEEEEEKEDDDDEEGG